MELLIIRHAQSANNALADQRDRVVDPPLTDLGVRQAELVAMHLANGAGRETWPMEGRPSDAAVHGPGITRLYCSAMLRALQTASPIGRALGLPPHVWVDIHEAGGMWLDHGKEVGVRGYPGMTRTEIAARFPDTILPDDVTASGWWRYGFEERSYFTERAARVAAALRNDAQTDERLAIVTHGDFATYLLRALLSVPVEAGVSFHHNNTGMTRVRFRPDGRVSVRFQNRVVHLPPEMTT